MFYPHCSKTGAIGLERKDAIFIVLILVTGLLAGGVGATLSSQVFIQSGPQGSVGPQGIPGVNGTDSILQILQNRNDTQIDTSNVTTMRWYDFSDFDSSMEMAINVQQNSRIFAQFSGAQTLQSPASIWIRVTVDNNYNSSRHICSLEPPASGTMSGHIEFLTDPLNEGTHRVNVQFWIEEEPFNILILDRTLTAIEVASQ